MRMKGLFALVAAKSFRRIHGRGTTTSREVVRRRAPVRCAAQVAAPDGVSSVGVRRTKGDGRTGALGGGTRTGAGSVDTNAGRVWAFAEPKSAAGVSRQAPQSRRSCAVMARQTAGGISVKGNATPALPSPTDRL